MALALVLVLLLGGGVGFAAEQATPGDVLYPIKTSINEEVRGALAFSTEDKAQLYIDLTERRLEEAEKLASRGKLSADAFASLKTNFDQESTEAQRYIQEVGASGHADAALKLATNFQSIIDGHRKALGDLEGKEGNEQNDFNSLFMRMDARSESVFSLRNDLNTTLMQSTEERAQAQGSVSGSSSASASQNGSTTIQGGVNVQGQTQINVPGASGNVNTNGGVEIKL